MPGYGGIGRAVEVCWQRRMNPAGCCGQLTGPRLPAVAMAGAWSWAPGLVSVCRRWVLGVEIMITCEPSTSAMSAPARGVGRIGDQGPGRVLVCHGRPPGQVTPNAVLPTPGAGAPGGWRGLDRRGVGY